MLGRLAAVVALAALMGCAGLEPAGRNAARSPQPTSAPSAVVSAPAPAPTASPPTSAPAPAVAAAAPPAAAPVPAPRAAPPTTVASNDPPRTTIDTSRQRQDDIVVPGVRERQVPAPQGDPRSTSERMEDINAWDRCVTNVQAAYERDPMRPQLASPEEYCSQSLGMADRTAIPISRQERRRN